MKPDMSLLSQFFDSKDMSALWMRLKADRQKSDLTVIEAWEALKKLKGTNKAKNDTLINFLTLPPGAWQERLLTVTEAPMWCRGVFGSPISVGAQIDAMQRQRAEGRRMCSA